MQSFRQYFEQKKVAPWHASKKEVLQMWQSLKGGPIVMRPIVNYHKGTRFRSDGIRLTGSFQFIQSVLSRFKDLMAYESSPGTKVDVELRQINDMPGMETGPSYVCYIYIEQK
jgi:hypothetical protein